jgi:hypothetical protein
MVLLLNADSPGHGLARLVVVKNIQEAERESDPIMV